MADDNVVPFPRVHRKHLRAPTGSPRRDPRLAPVLFAAKIQELSKKHGVTDVLQTAIKAMESFFAELKVPVDQKEVAALVEALSGNYYEDLCDMAVGSLAQEWTQYPELYRAVLTLVKQGPTP